MCRGSVVLLLAVTLLTSSIVTACGGPGENTAEWHANRTYELCNERRYDEAIQECNEAIELDPQYAWAYAYRGWAYNWLGECGQAIEDYSEAIELEPQYAWAYAGRGWAYNWLGEYERAIEDYDEAIRLDPQDADVYYNRGLAYRMLGRKDEAISDFDNFISLTDSPQWIEMARQQIEELKE